MALQQDPHPDSEQLTARLKLETILISSALMFDIFYSLLTLSRLILFLGD